MIGFLRGVLLGGVVAVLGLVAVSQLSGPAVMPVADAPVRAVLPPSDITPQAEVIAQTPTVVPPAATPIVDPPAAAPPPLVQSDAPNEAAPPAVAPQPMPPAVVADAPPTVQVPPPRGAAPPQDTPATADATPQEPPVLPDLTAPGDRDMAGLAAGVDGGVMAAQTPAPDASLPLAPVVPGGEAVPDAAEPPPPAEEALLQPAPLTPAPGPAADAGTFPPTAALGDQAPGVVTGRLPRIGDAAPAAKGAPAAALAEPADQPPLLRYARAFAGANGKPLFAMLLVDTGDQAINRADLAALALPLSVVIDPLSPGAADRAAIWRAGGQEVVMAASGIPAGASPSDLEQTFQALAEALPQAVAVIDPDGTAFQDNRPLATQVVPILAAQGRGLVTYDLGLNAADQVARRDGLGAAMIFRRIDGADEDAPVIRRYLDRAAFKAAQDGRVVVIGTLRPETISAILEWAVEGKSATVTLAPISVLLAGQGG